MSEKTMIEQSTDETVSKIWRDVLRIAQLAPTDNFIDLGGNSLRASEIAWRIRNEVGVDVEVDAVLTEETFADFMKYLKSAQATT